MQYLFYKGFVYESESKIISGKTPTQVAEEIQSGFMWDDSGEFPIKMKRTYWSDLLGSDWGSGKSINLQEMTPIEAYNIVHTVATRKYGQLPWQLIGDVGGIGKHFRL